MGGIGALSIIDAGCG